MKRRIGAVILFGLVVAVESFAALPPMSMYFDGVDDYVQVTNPTTLDGASRATWSFWFKYEHDWASGGDASIVSRASASGKRQFDFRADTGTAEQAGTLLFTIHPSEKGAASWRTPPYLGLSAAEFKAKVQTAWHHIVVVFDGTQVKSENRLRVYRNGTLLDGQGPDLANVSYYSGEFPSVLTAPVASDLFLGVSNASGGNRFRDGRLDDVAIWVEIAATHKQAAELFNAGRPGDLARSSLGLPQHWWQGNGSFADSGSRRNHATAYGAVTFQAPPRGVLKHRRGQFDVANFTEAGDTWAITVEGDLCGEGADGCGNLLMINWRNCRTPVCDKRRARWKDVITTASPVTFAGYQFLAGTDRFAFMDPAEPATPGVDIFDDAVPSSGDYYDDIDLLGWTGCVSGHTDCHFCVNDVLNNFAAVEKRAKHESAFFVTTGHHVNFDPVWDAQHYQGIARLPDNFSNPMMANKTPIFAVTAHNPGRLWLLPLHSKGTGPYPQLANNAKIGTNRLEFGVDEDNAALPVDSNGQAYDRTHGLYYMSYGSHLGGLQAAGAHWLAVATDAENLLGNVVGPHQGAALLIKTDNVAAPWPSHVVDKVISSHDHQIYLDESDTAGAVAITKLQSGFYLLDIQSHVYHAFFLSDTTDLETTSQWHFIGQRVLGLDTDLNGLDPSNYQSINLFAQCSDGRLFLAGASNTVEWDWHSDDRMGLHVVAGTVRVLRDGSDGHIKSIRNPSNDALWGAAWSWYGGADDHAPYSHYHLDASETNNSLFVQMDQETGHTPFSAHFHLDATDFRAGSGVFPNTNKDLMVYSVARDAPGDHLHFEEFPNRNSLGLMGNNTTCSRPDEEWIAFYKSTNCTATASNEVLIYDRYFAPDRDNANFGNLNDFHDVATCVRACVAPGYTWQVCKDAHFGTCQTFIGPAPNGLVLPNWLQGQVSSAKINH